MLALEWSDDFRLFCELNAQACPLLDVTEPGSPRPLHVAPDADLRTDLPGYRVYEEGVIRKVPDLKDVWRDDHVAFLLGCSFSFERALIEAGVPMRHIELGRTVPMYVTSRQCAPAGKLHGPLVVSMRPIATASVGLVRDVCAKFPAAHGVPVHVGDPAELGIAHVARPDFGDPVPIGPHETPAFWACGVTPQVVLRQSGCPWYASHEPGQMFITDRDDHVEILTD